MQDKLRKEQELKKSTDQKSIGELTIAIEVLKNKTTSALKDLEAAQYVRRQKLKTSALQETGWCCYFTSYSHVLDVISSL